MNIGEGLSRAERETVIRRSEEDQHWHIWTSSPVMARKLGKLAISHKVTGMQIQGGVHYTFPLNVISLRKLRVLTEEQKMDLQARGKRLSEASKSKTQ